MFRQKLARAPAARLGTVIPRRITASLRARKLYELPITIQRWDAVIEVYKDRIFARVPLIISRTCFLSGKVIRNKKLLSHFSQTSSKIFGKMRRDGKIFSFCEMSTSCSRARTLLYSLLFKKMPNRPVLFIFCNLNFLLKLLIGMKNATLQKNRGYN